MSDTCPRVICDAVSPSLAVVRLDRDLPLPSRAHDGDAGVDLYSAHDVELAPGERALVGTGVAVAIPHGKISGLDRIVASFARSVKGVDFESIDGQPTHLFFLLVVPEHSGGQHLKALARISRFFRDAEFRQKLISAGSLDEVFRSVQEEDEKF